MIKKTLLGIFITLVGILNFSNAGQIFITNGEYTTNDNLHYDFTFQNGNNFLTNGTYRVFSVFSSEYYPSAYPRFYNVFWTDNGLYVIQTCQGGYECSNIHTAIQQQGYIGSYCKTTYSLNCTNPDISIESFIGNDNYKNPSSFTLHDAGQNLNFCFDYEDLNESLCFNAGIWYGVSNSLGFSYNPFPSELGTSADTISSYFATSPRGEPITPGNNTTTRTGKNYYCPTYREILQNYGNKYNTGLCYNGTLKYENGSITTVQQKDIFTVFSNYNEYTQRINLYYNNCKAPATQQQCENVFSGEREKYSIIANAINNGVDDKGLWNYCNIGLNYDLNTTTCVASTGSTYKEPITTNELLEHIENLTNIGTVKTPSTGNIINGLLGEGQTREDINARDLIGNLDQIKEKLSTMFTERSGVEGIIPDYIMWLILVSLLLTVLFKK